ncbi:MAG TPA: c-type cytochrome [Rhizomicrobium sp.]
MNAKYRLLLPLLLLCTAQPALADSKEITLGRERAIEYCSGCHEVTRQQPRPEPVPFPEENARVVTPSFLAISIKYEGQEKELRAFIKAPAHPMKEQEFLEADLNAIVAYIKSAQKNW